MRMRNPLFLCEDPACEAEFTILDADLALSDNLLSPTTYLLNTGNTPQNTQGDICIWICYLGVFVLFLWTKEGDATFALIVEVLC